MPVTTRTMWMMGAAAATVAAVACAPAKPKLGPIGEVPTNPTRITAVDSGHPPTSVSVQLDEPGYAAVLLVAPGHSATLLYPPDDTTRNRLDAGAHQLRFTVPDNLIPMDSARMAAAMARARERDRDTTVRTRQRAPITRTTPIQPLTPTFLLVVTSPQPLSYTRITERTNGVSIPLGDLEALNAIGKTVKSTIPAEPRVWAGFYQQVQLRKPTS